MKKFLGYILMVIFLPGCSSYITNYYNYKQEQQTVTTRNYALPYFDSIAVSGNMYVEIEKGVPTLSSAAQKQYNDKITAQVTKHTLYLTLPDYINQKNIAVLIKINNLKSLHAANHAYIIANNLTSANLEIAADSHASINLQGMMSVNKIIQKSDGKIEINWIRSKKLEIESYDHGLIMLAGKVKELTAKLRNNAQLDARYLRTKTADIFATDIATAHIWVADLLNAYTERRSNIYYYCITKHRNIISKDHSNVLNVDWIQ